MVAGAAGGPGAAGGAAAREDSAPVSDMDSSLQQHALRQWTTGAEQQVLRDGPRHRRIKAVCFQGGPHVMVHSS